MSEWFDKHMKGIEKRNFRNNILQLVCVIIGCLAMVWMWVSVGVKWAN